MGTDDDRLPQPDKPNPPITGTPTGGSFTLTFDSTGKPIRGSDTPDMVKSPPHYSASRLGFECIEMTRLMPFCTGNAAKYVFRADAKGNTVEDLEKARVYTHWARDENESSSLPGRRNELQTIYFRYLDPRVTGKFPSEWPDWQVWILGHIIYEEWDEAENLIDHWLRMARATPELFRESD